MGGANGSLAFGFLNEKLCFISNPLSEMARVFSKLNHANYIALMMGYIIIKRRRNPDGVIIVLLYYNVVKAKSITEAAKDLCG